MFDSFYEQLTRDYYVIKSAYLCGWKSLLYVTSKFRQKTGAFFESMNYRIKSDVRDHYS